MKRVIATLSGLALAAGWLAACGGDDDSAGLASTGGGGPGGAAEEGPEPPDDLEVVEGDLAEVRAIDNTFDAEAVQVAPGTTVRWTNRGHQDHDVVPAEGRTWGIDADGFAPGDFYEHTFETPGVYHYYCTIHGTASAGMIGVVVVE